MNRGLLYKAWRETWGMTLLFAAGLFLFEVLIAYVIPDLFSDAASVLLANPIFSNVLRALLGTDVGTLGPTVYQSFAWVHPVVLTLFWAHAILFCTRMPVAEVDRGTIDVLLGLPVSRWEAYVTETVLWIASGLALLTSALLGSLLGRALTPSDVAPTHEALPAVLTNLLCLYLAVGGLTYLTSSVSERRGRAVGTVFGIVLASFLLNFLSQFWEPARALAFLGLLNYYRPFEILRVGRWPLGDIAILAALALLLWGVGGWLLSRRDIRTV